MKKIAIIGSVGLPAKYGGWETLVDQLTKKLNHKFCFTVFCSSKKYSEKLSSFNGANLTYVNLNANGIQSILYDLISILRALRFADTLLILGVSGCIFLPILKIISNKKIIVNIDGLEWRRAKWGIFAKTFLKVSEAAAVMASDLLISDNKAIQRYIHNRYGRSSTFIPYGGDSISNDDGPTNFLEKLGLKKGSYAIKVCRIEPENNLDLILEALQSQINLNLVVIGNWNNSAYGASLRKRYGHLRHFNLIDPIYDLAVLNELRSNALVYIHGHSAGGTNPSLVEAMYLGLPVVAFDCDFNKETTHGKAIYFDSGDQLINIFSDLNQESLNINGLKMKSIAVEFYNWQKIASEYAEILE